MLGRPIGPESTLDGMVEDTPGRLDASNEVPHEDTYVDRAPGERFDVRGRVSARTGAPRRGGLSRLGAARDRDLAPGGVPGHRHGRGRARHEPAHAAAAAGGSADR